jgi:protein TonB
VYATQRTNPNTRLFGAATAVLMTIGVGYALIVTTMETFVPPVDKPILLLPALQPEETPETLPELPDITERVDVAETKPEIVLPVFETNETPITLPTLTAPTTPAADAGPSSPVAAPAVVVAPRLLEGDKPSYPPASVRAKEQGSTTLEVCVSASGRVTDARLQTSSGFSRLDDAALVWVRQARFTPGTRDGARTAMCGRQVTYQWRLQDAR